MLSHDNLLYSNRRGYYYDPKYEQMLFKGVADRIVSYLPLSHVAGLKNDIINQLGNGLAIYFARPDALQGTLIETMRWARPTYFMGVPRVFEKIEEAIKVQIEKKGPLAKKLIAWAMTKG